MPEEPNTAREDRHRVGVAREYTNDDITVFWAPEFCIHTANCMRAEPEVFDSSRRPWVEVDQASADRIAAAVMRCPTGALAFERHDGGEQEVAPEETSIDARPNGPLFVRGRVRIMDGSGNVIREATRMALCRCGGSANKPFCDNTHLAIGFQA
jgi:uncharacterized Fe-S cluster protein YjdI